jgi:hypothetical protein
MIDNRQKTYWVPNGKSAWRQLNFHLLLLFFAFLISGCKPTSTEQYVNPNLGVQLEISDNWKEEYNERNGSIIVKANKGFLRKESVRIEILGNSCLSNSLFDNSTLERDIERIRNLYSLDSVGIKQEPIKVESEEYKVIKAIIEIPTNSMMHDTNRIQVRNRGLDIMQTIDMYAISDRGYLIRAYIYEGDDETLNKRAQEIVSSIRSTCLTEP